MNNLKTATPPAETVTLADPRSNRSLSLPVMSGTVGPKVIDVRKLYGETDMFTYDPGYTSTASCESKITYIDGDKGVLLYRGYPIEELAEHSDFMEVAYLLLKGELPNAEEKARFVSDITYHTMVHEQILSFLSGFRRDAHPMAVMCGVVGALSAFYHDSTDINDPRHRVVASYRLIAKMPTIAAMAYKYSIGQPFVYPRNELSYAENFLHMTFAVPAEEYKVSKVLARAMDRIFVLHADHEQNASTSTVGSPARAAPTPLPASRPASPRCGDRRTEGPTKPCSTCCARSATRTKSPSSSSAPRTRTIRSASWASGTGSTSTTTRVRP